MSSVILFLVAVVLIFQGASGFVLGLQNKTRKPRMVKHLGPLKFLYNEKKQRIFSLIAGPLLVIVGIVIIIKLIGQGF